ncbi:dihydrofolate reductase [Actinomycetaceae bacterium MB13-C1-2]|nr:dihydrofolate reductase [Actinomycetaceae bacterium MB13-C1-2]
MSSAETALDTRPVRASIWAEDRVGVIGDGERMLWHVPADFKHFKESTIGCPIIMGRASFEALGGPLPGRVNIVVTRSPGYQAEGVHVAHSIEDALEIADRSAEATGAKTVWITGGGSIYRETMDLVNELVITDLDLKIPADDRTLVMAPIIDPDIWQIDRARTDDEWRPRSGDARWRVTTYVRR